MKVDIDLLCKNLSGDTPAAPNSGNEVDDGNASKTPDSASFVHVRDARGRIRNVLNAFCYVVYGYVFVCHTNAGKRHLRGKVHFLFTTPSPIFKNAHSLP